jgi:hypothetical protein
MAFPTSPADGATTTQNGIRYTYASATNSWTRSPASSSTLSLVSDSFTGDGVTIAFTLSITPVSVDVVSCIVDGVPQLRGAFVLAGNVVTFTGTPANGALIEIRTMQVAGLGVLTGLVYDSFTGNGSTTQYTLSTQPTNKNYTIVTIGGLIQNKVNYSVSGTTLTFSTAPPNTAPIEVITLGPAVSTSTVTLVGGSGGGSGSSISNGNSNVSIGTANSNVTISVNDTSNVVVIGNTVVAISGNLTSTNANLGNLVTSNYFSGNGSLLTGITVASSQPGITTIGTLGNLIVSGNINAANVGTSSTMYYGNGYNLTGITVSAGTAINSGTSNVAVVSNNGNVAIGVNGTSNVVVISTAQANVNGTLGVSANISGGNLTTVGIVSATGNVSGGNLTTVGIVSATGNVSGNFFIGNGSQLTGITAGTSVGKSVALNILFGG